MNKLYLSDMSEVTVELGGRTPGTSGGETEWNKRSLFQSLHKETAVEETEAPVVKEINEKEVREEIERLRQLASSLENETKSISSRASLLKSMTPLCSENAVKEAATQLDSVETVCGIMEKLPFIRDSGNGEENYDAGEYAFCIQSSIFIHRLTDSQSDARARLLKCGGLSSIAFIALNEKTKKARHESMSILAIICTWSGPRHAMEIVETPNVIRCFDMVLRDKENEFDQNLKMAIVDAVSVLASRNRARRVLRENEIGAAVAQAVKTASISRNINLAAKASVASGALDGKTLNNMGFVVEADDEGSDDDFASAESSGQDVKMTPEVQGEDQHFENIRRTQDGRKNDKSGPAISASNPFLDVGDYLSLARATAAATRGGQVESGAEKKTISQWNALVNREPIGDLRRKNGEAYKQLKKKSQVGIPQSVRWKVWPYLLAVDTWKQKHPNLYETCLTTPIAKNVEACIDKDVTRTMPSHELFWSGGAQIGLVSLRNVLRAYAAQNTEVGYCQGMSSICALFLVNASKEEDAFFMLLAFMEQFNFKNVYSPGLPYLYEMIEDLKFTGEKQFPALFRKLEKDQVPIDSFLPVWFMTGFTYYFPPRLAFRIWDILLCEGNPKMFIRAALAVLALSEQKISNWSMEDITLWFQNRFAEEGSEILDDEKKFIDIALSLDILHHHGGERKLAAKLTSALVRSRRLNMMAQFSIRTGGRVINVVKKPFSRLQTATP